MYIWMMFMGVAVICGSVFVIGGISKTKIGYSMTLIGVLFGFSTIAYGYFGHTGKMADLDGQAALLDNKIARGECEILALEEVNFGSNKLRYKCSDGVEVVEKISDDRFKQLLESSIMPKKDKK